MCYYKSKDLQQGLFSTSSRILSKTIREKYKELVFNRYLDALGDIFAIFWNFWHFLKTLLDLKITLGSQNTQGSQKLSFDDDDRVDPVDNVDNVDNIDNVDTIDNVDKIETVGSVDHDNGANIYTVDQIWNNNNCDGFWGFP